MFIEELKHPCTGYNNVLISDIFTFLYKTYSNITSIDLEDNERKVNKHYTHFTLSVNKLKSY